MILQFLYMFACIFGLSQGRPGSPHESNSKALSNEEVKLFEKLISPGDTRLQQDTKLLLAKYLAQQAAVVYTVTQTPAPTTTTTETITTEPTTTIASTTTLRAVPQGSIPSINVGSTIRPTPAIPPSQGHVLGQVDKIISNVSQGNIVGIVDSALGIRAPTPVRNLVIGILNLIFCNPVDRYLARCTAGGTGSAGATANGIIG